jgi:hypothetical protein
MSSGQPTPIPIGSLEIYSVIFQNFGRKTAESVDIILSKKPDLFQFHQKVNYVETTNPAKQHVITIKSLASKQPMTLQLISYSKAPELLSICSEAGFAPNATWMMVRKYPLILDRAIKLLAFAGAGVSVYWIYKVAILALKAALGAHFGGRRAAPDGHRKNTPPRNAAAQAFSA